MTEPKCPQCGVEGISHIVSTESTQRSKHKNPWFEVAHCDSCGHIYGVFSKHVFTRSAEKGPRLVVQR